MYSKEKDDSSKKISDLLNNLHVHHKDVYIRTIHDVRHNHQPYEEIIGAEKVLLVSIIFLKMLMSSFWVRHFAEQDTKYYRVVDFFNFIKPLIFLTILMYDLHQYAIVMAIVAYLLIDLFISIIGTLLLSDIFVKPLGVRKQFLSLGSNLGEIIFGFAILYLHYNALGYIGNDKIVGPIDAIYYSMCTLSTVGYGDISQINNMGSIISIIQMIYGLVFVGIILSAYVNKVNIKSE